MYINEHGQGSNRIKFITILSLSERHQIRRRDGVMAERRTIVCKGVEVPYELRPDSRRRSMVLQIHPIIGLRVYVPPYVAIERIEAFLLDNEAEVLKLHEEVLRTRKKADEHFKKATENLVKLPRITKKNAPKLRKKLLAILEERLSFWNRDLRVVWKRYQVRNSKSRWGSCTGRGVLTFSLKLVFLPMHLIDSVIVHELCHLRHMGHSPAFWQLVKMVMPDYEEREKEKKAKYPRIITHRSRSKLI